MNNLILNPGDIFCTRNPMWLGRAICGMEKFWASDNKAEYSHSGIIIGHPAITFEALWTAKSQDLFKSYKGEKVLIGRHSNMTLERFTSGWNKVRPFKGSWYPWWRLFFHIIPPISKYVSDGSKAVCSELAGIFIDGSGIYPEGYFWKGKNPDHIADMIHKWQGWQVIFEDII